MASDHRRSIEIRNGGVYFNRHQRPGMTPSHKTSNIMADVERGKNLTCCRKCALNPHQHNRVIFSCILPGDIVKSSRAHRGTNIPIVSGVDGLNDESLVVPQKGGEVID